jgi:hypothetical protein
MLKPDYIEEFRREERKFLNKHTHLPSLLIQEGYKQNAHLTRKQTLRVKRKGEVLDVQNERDGWRWREAGSQGEFMDPIKLFVPERWDASDPVNRQEWNDGIAKMRDHIRSRVSLKKPGEVSYQALAQFYNTYGDVVRKFGIAWQPLNRSVGPVHNMPLTEAQQKRGQEV